MSEETVYLLIGAQFSLHLHGHLVVSDGLGVEELLQKAAVARPLHQQLLRQTLGLAHCTVERHQLDQRGEAVGGHQADGLVMITHASWSHWTIKFNGVIQSNE